MGGGARQPLRTPDVGTVVVGAGIAGLSAALELQAAGTDALVIDPSDRPGGVLRTDHVAGFVIERGPNTIQVKAPMRAFLRRWQLEDALLRALPASRLRFLQRGGRLVPVPLSPLAFARTELLSAKAKLRLLAEPFVRRGAGASESVAEFTSRRLGIEVASGLVGPFLTGVYAGDEEALGAEAVFGGLVDLERRYGSIAIGLAAGALGRARPRARRRGGTPKGLPGTWSHPEGLGPFARHLSELLAEPPALGSRVTGLARDGALWRVDVSSAGGDQSLRAERVVVATGATEAAEILRGVDGDAADALASIEYAPIVGIPLGVDPATARQPIEGFGFLVPRDEASSLLGCLFMSRLFPSRAPEGRELLHCMLGGTRWPEALHLPDDVLRKRLFADLEGSLGLREEPRALAVTRWARAIPQPGRDHVRCVGAARERLRALGGLELAGAYVAGVSVADTLASGVAAARALLSGLDSGRGPGPG